MTNRGMSSGALTSIFFLWHSTQTVQAGGSPVDHLRSRQLSEGTIDANLKWKFNVTELKFSFLVLSFDRRPFATARPSGQVVQ